jgi:salicylate hydroxylase
MIGTAGPRVAIVGAGIGGLALALALAERGVRAEVYEQAQELTEIGAAIALSANSLRELGRLGLTGQIGAFATVPTELIFRDWRDGRRIAAHPVRKDGWYRDRFGAPYFGVHRADLQRVLGDALGAGPLHLGARLTGIEERSGDVELTFADGRTAHADVVVGADGVRSTVRRWLTGTDDAVYSGTSAFRGIVDSTLLPSLPDPAAIQFWAGPGAHLLHYAIGPDAEAVNFFAVVTTPERWPHPGSVAECPPDLPVGSFAGWHPAVTEMIAAANSPLSWALFTVRPLTRWYRGRVAILGDAAHGMLPHHGQGANTAMEDAFVLAGLIAGAGSDPASVFPRFQSMRRARTRAIQRASWETGTLLHLPDDSPDLAARDRAFASVPADYSWIHGYDAQRALGDAGR